MPEDEEFGWLRFWADLTQNEVITQSFLSCQRIFALLLECHILPAQTPGADEGIRFFSLVSFGRIASLRLFSLVEGRQFLSFEPLTKRNKQRGHRGGGGKEVNELHLEFEPVTPPRVAKKINVK